MCTLNAKKKKIGSQLLYRLGQETKTSGKFYPKRYFSVDRVFRNETMDATHLCEFHQVYMCMKAEVEMLT